MKNPFFISLNPDLLSLEGGSTDTQKLLSFVGNNTGNLVFTEGLHSAVKHEHLFCGYTFDPKTLQNKFDGIIISAANWLQPHGNFSKLVDLLEQVDLPVVIVGIGAQSNDKDSIPNINDSVLRLVALASRRSAFISSRGEFTAKVLLHYGVKNVAITGCPSLLLNKSVQPNIKIKKTLPTRIAFHSTRHIAHPSIFQNVPANRFNLAIYRVALRDSFELVLQSEQIDIKALLSPSALTDEEKNHLCKVYDTNNLEIIMNFIQKKAHVFFRIKDWIKYYQSLDFIIGTRIHGTILGLLSGVPSLLITHDMRTEELAKAMGIPFVSFNSINIYQPPIAELYKSLDLSTYYDKFPNYLNIFRDFFSSNNICHTL